MSGIIDYSKIEPSNKDEVLDDLYAVSGGSPTLIEDLRVIKPFAVKFGATQEYERVCQRFGINL